MIILKSIKITNFLSHDSTTISFEPNTRLLIDGKSGSGKSSIVEAIIWVLYGKGRVENRNLIKNGKKYAAVMIKLLDNTSGIHYNIERRVSDKGKQTVEVAESTDGENFRPSLVSGLKETQEWIEKKLLHSSYMLFINSVAYPQDNVENFVKQTAAKRKEMLLEIANIEDYDTYYEKARTMLSEKSEKVVRAKMTIEQAEEYISINKPMADKVSMYTLDQQVLKNGIQGMEEKLSAIHKYDVELSEITGKVSKLQAEFDAVNDKCEYVQRQIEEKIKSLKNWEGVGVEAENIDVSRIPQIESEIEQREFIEKQNQERQYKLNSLMADKPVERDYDADIESINKQLIALIKDNNTFCAEIGRGCPTLEKKAQTQVSYFEEQLINKNTAKQQQFMLLRAYSDKIMELGQPAGSPDNYNKIVELRKELAEIKQKENAQKMRSERLLIINDIKEELAKLSEEGLKCSGLSLTANLNWSIAVADKKDIEKKIESSEKTKLESQLSSAKKLLSENIRLLSVANIAKDGVESATKAIKDTKESTKELMVETEALELIKDAFGSKGIKTTVIEYLIPKLEDKINEILSQLSDFRIRLDTQKKGADGETTIEGLYINIYNELGETFDFASYSGGEKLKISVAISEALASLQKVGFRILDEIFVGIDAASITGFAAVLEKLQQNFGQTICISHLREIKDLFERSITITKTDGVSVIS